jgi:hypothetical protein
MTRQRPQSHLAHVILHEIHRANRRRVLLSPQYSPCQHEHRLLGHCNRLRRSASVLQPKQSTITSLGHLSSLGPGAQTKGLNRLQNYTAFLFRVFLGGTDIFDSISGRGAGALKTNVEETNVAMSTHGGELYTPRQVEGA